MSEDEIAALDRERGRRPCSADDGVGQDGGGADCEETVRKLYHFLDGALTEERRHAISRHLDSCGDCVEVIGFETELRRVVADRCKDHVPEPLKVRIAEAIALESQAEPTGAEPA